jgi:alpha,alpha-trehalase
MGIVAHRDPPVATLAADIIARRAGRHLLLLCDFDGTLTAFNPDPRAVRLDARVARVLGSLASRGDASVGVISGRRLQDVRDRVTVPGDLYIAGFHGLEIHAPGESFIHPDASAAAATIRTIAATLGPALSGLRGVFIEDKDLSIALHFREATPAAGARAQSQFLAAARDDLDAGRVRLLPGSCVLELLPATSWHKGSALEWIRERVERLHGPVFTIYIGDDVTDEDGFRAVGADGIAIGASSRVSGAAFHVDGPPAVEQLLHLLQAATRP